MPGLFASGSFDGEVAYWMAHSTEPLAIRHSHEQAIWDMAWHPAGHVLATVSNDTKVRFWCRDRPGSDGPPNADLPEDVDLRRKYDDGAGAARFREAQFGAGRGRGGGFQHRRGPGQSYVGHG